MAKSVAKICVLAFAFTPISYADDEVFGDWTVGVTKSKSHVYAATANDSGAIFGEYCSVSDGNCQWLLGMDISCDPPKDDDDPGIPTLANATGGAASLEVLCDGKLSGALFRYVFTSWEQLELTLKGSDKVGFAFPMQSDRFKVVRFSLEGMKEAATFAEKAAAKAQKASTTNQTL